MIVRTRLARPLVALTLGAALLGGATAQVAVGAQLAPEAGSKGIGDPYFPQDGNGGIDVVRYDIHDRYGFGTGRLSGKSKLTIRATKGLSRFNLDFLLPVQSVRVDGRAAEFDQGGDHELRITPRSPVGSGEEFKVVVRYDGVPSTEVSQGESNWLANGSEVVAMNEPHMATWWFPANDHPRDKAAFDIKITVPRGKDVIANGTLVDRRRHGGLATTHWRSSEPMATYLAFFAAGSFDVEQGSYAGRPWYVAVSDGVPVSLRHEAMALMRRSGEITAWLESVIGPYPFSSTGGVVTALEPGFALENQTRPTYPPVGSSSLSLVVHELAHQWFGDSVSVDGWRDIWLNEGFAQFFELYYAETHGGQAAQTWLEQAYDRFVGNAPFWSVRIDDPGRNHIFDSAIYDRGAMAVQALRHRIGEPAFWTLIQTWVAQHRYGNATVADFQTLAETTSGQDLDGFFDAWLRVGAPPAKTAVNGL